jgi:hypothetical protein
MKSFKEFLVESDKVNPELLSMGVSAEDIRLFKKYRAASLQPNVTHDPYLASTGHKAAHTRAFNNFMKAMEVKGLNVGLINMKMNQIADYHGVDALHNHPGVK